MTKAEIVNQVAERTGMSRKDAMQAVELFLDSIKTGLKNGEKISLVGFGTFFLKEKKARNGRNPRTGQRISIPAKKIATFKPGKAFRQLVNGETPASPMMPAGEQAAWPENDLD